jgi:NitT/TauT family transport system substrate-binding protein
MIRRTLITLALVAAVTAATSLAARADDTISVSAGQKGAWDEMVMQQGVDAGIFKKEHIDLVISYTAGGPDTIQAVATGGADMGFGIGTTAVIAAFAKGAPIKIASAAFTGASDLYFYAKSDSPINSYKDLTGKSIGFTRPGSSTYVAEHVLAEQENVQPNYVSTGEMSATLTQVMSGQVDVGWAVVPVNLDLIAKKQIKIIARGADAKALQNQTVRVNIANTKWLDAPRDAAVRFWRAYAATIDWMYKNPNSSLANLARYNGITLDVARAVLPFYPQKALALYPVASFEKSVNDAVTFKFIPAPLSAEQQKAIFDIVFIKK